MADAEESQPATGGIVVFRVGSEYWRIDHTHPVPRAEFLTPSRRWKEAAAPPLLFSESRDVEIVGPDEARRLGLPE